MPSAVQPASQRDFVFLLDYKQMKVTANWDSRRAEKSDLFEIITVPIRIEDYHSDTPQESETIEEYVNLDSPSEQKESMQSLT
jgi:hypothetical protein